MCVLYLALEAHPDYPLVVAANRDEFFDRPGTPAGPWPGRPDVLAGRDLTGGGTWMGITRGGRFAAVTNFRDRLSHRPDRRSRGELVRDFLLGFDEPGAYVDSLRSRVDHYNWFNLIVGEGGTYHLFGSQAREGRRLTPGIHGISNGGLDDPWPKVVRGKERLGELLAENPPDLVEALLTLLVDDAPAPDESLPDTGVGLELERVFSSIFVRLPSRGYGTRSSSVIVAHADGFIRFVELTHEPDGKSSRVEHAFR